MNSNTRFYVSFALITGVVGILVLVGCWLIAKAFTPKYPNLNVNCFETEHTIPVGQGSLSAKTEGLNRERLNIFVSQERNPVASIDAVFGYIRNPVFSPDDTLLLFSEDGPAFHEVTIIRACDMGTGQQEFYILDLPYVNAIGFSADGTTFTLHFYDGTEKLYRSATGKLLD